MSVFPVDKVALYPPATPVEGERVRDAIIERLPSAVLDPHALMAMEAWPAQSPRLFETTSAESHADVDQAATHIVSFLV